MIRLRGHHLLCMLTYVGKGYSPAFVENYDAIAGRLSAGEKILVVDGPDDVCAPLLRDADCHCHEASVQERDRRALAALSALLEIPLETGATLRLDAARLRRMRAAFAAGRIRSACAAVGHRPACEWSSLCSRIADGGYDGVRITR